MIQHLNADDEFAALLRAVRRSSWRWECQPEYAVDLPEVDRWRAGLPPVATDADRAWLAHLRDLRARGVPFQRVRLLPEPLTDYAAWMLQAIGQNVAAGEDVRWLPAPSAAELDLPTYDFYLLDDKVAILRFDSAQVLIGADVDDDPAIVERHQAHRRAAWAAAIPHGEITEHL